MKWSIHFIKWIFAFFLILPLSCTPLWREDPDKLLGMALSGIRGIDQYTFEGTSRRETVGVPADGEIRFKGVVKNHNDMYMKIFSNEGQTPTPNAADSGWIRLNASGMPEPYRNWNPWVRFDELKHLKKSVESLPNGEVPGSDKIRVLLDEKALKEKIVRELGLHVRTHIEERVDQAKRKYGLSDREASRMRQEMLETTGKFAPQLDKIVDSLRVDGEYVLWIDRKSRLPVRMDVQTVLHYVSGGEKLQETFASSYRFGDFDDVPMNALN